MNFNENEKNNHGMNQEIFEIHETARSNMIDFLISIWSVMMINKLNNFFSIIGYFLSCWYIFWLAELFSLIFKFNFIQPNWTSLYVFIDISTFSYLFYAAHYIHSYKNKITQSISELLMVWFIYYTFVDLGVPTMDQPSSLWFYISMIALCSTTLGMIIKSEFFSERKK